MTIYLIGPSGVGKTSCARRAAQLLRVEHINLDDMCRDNQFNWAVCGPLLASLEAQAANDAICRIVDIGAGTQTLPQLRDYLLRLHEHVVLVWGPESEVIRRNPLGPGRPLNDYRETEYTSRRPLYSVALHRIDVTGMTESEANERFVGFLSGTLGCPRS